MFSLSLTSRNRSAAVGVIVSLILSFAAAIFPEQQNSAVASQNTARLSSVGQDFWLSLSGNTESSDRSLNEIYVTSTQSGQVTFSWPNGLVEELNVVPGTTLVVNAFQKLSSQFSLQAKTSSQAVRISSSVPVAVQNLHANTTTDTSIVLPTDALGRHYVVMAYPGDPEVGNSSLGGRYSRFNVLATEPGLTVVTVTSPSASSLVDWAGNEFSGSFSVVLDQGELFTTRAWQMGGDVSGAEVIANKKVAVVSSAYVRELINGEAQQAGDLMFEQNFPIESWGTRFLTRAAPNATANSNRHTDLYRVFASQDGTVVDVNGTQITLSKASWYQFRGAQSSPRVDSISASKPVGVMHYVRGSEFRLQSSDPLAQADPSMLHVVPLGNWLSSYTLNLGPNLNRTGLFSHLTNQNELYVLSIVTPVGASNSIQVNGSSIPSTLFTTDSSGEFATAQVSTSYGLQLVESAEPFGLSAFWFRTSYGSAMAAGFSYENQTLSPGLSGVTSSPSSLQATVSCQGSCGTGDSFSYVAVLKLNGNVVDSSSGISATNSQPVLFSNLSGNTTYELQASVNYNGQTSATVSSVVITTKPTATISALSVADTSATLTVGCTNCGTAPDSFTISATPVAGGPAITSNTNQISGLSSETTYSFSVVVAFAGTTSDVVLWQSNPVMTLPFVPIISAVSPPAVPLTGGSITVAGSNFTTSTELTLDGATLSFTVVSGTQITFTAPSDTAGSYDLAITNPVGTYTLSNAITYVAGPTLVTNSPVLGTTNGGTIVTLTGTDLITTTQVNVGSTTVSFSVISNSVVRFVTAATSAGVVDVGVVTIGGAATLSSALEFTSSPLIPVVSSITPTSGPNSGGTLITVTGQYFSGSYSDSVSAAINGVSGSSVILIDDSTLTFVSPAGSAGAGLDVSVATGGGLGTLAGAFTYTAPPAPVTAGSAPAVVINTPTITEFSTREIPATGAEVTATGLRLENISVLTLGGITVTIVSNTATSLTFTTGEMPVGVWDLRLVASNGTLVFQQAIEVVEIQEITAQSSGELIGFAVTLRFTGNSRVLNDQQESHLQRRLKSEADTIICWGYTTAQNPNSWALAHASSRAQAACNMALESMPGVSSIVRLRYGIPKDLAMRASVQFWRVVE